MRHTMYQQCTMASSLPCCNTISAIGYHTYIRQCRAFHGSSMPCSHTIMLPYYQCQEMALPHAIPRQLTHNSSIKQRSEAGSCAEVDDFLVTSADPVLYENLFCRRLYWIIWHLLVTSADPVSSENIYSEPRRRFGKQSVFFSIPLKMCPSTK